jgi:hypothetical protein
MQVVCEFADDDTSLAAFMNELQERALPTVHHLDRMTAILAFRNGGTLPEPAPLSKLESALQKRAAAEK